MTSKRVARALSLAVLFGAAACSAAPEADEEVYYIDQSMLEFMNNAMQPAAEGVWDRTGYLTDEAGFHTLFPQDEAGWREAEQASLILAELSNVLMLPGRRVAEKEWDGGVEAVRITALAAADAARAKDEEAFMQAALAINNACQSCHVRYDRPEAPANSGAAAQP